MNAQETTQLRQIVDRYCVLADQIKNAQDEQKEIADAAYDKGLVRAANHQDARKVVKKLAKESTWDEIQREAQRLMEEALDECRAALGLLADLPLGQAAQAEAGQADHQAEQPVKRGRGRPPGSKNKPKLATRNGVDVPEPAELPGELPVPDIPELPAA